MLGEQTAPVIMPLEYEGQQVYRTSHALLVADDTPPQGEAAFGNSAREVAKELVDVCGFPADNVKLLDGPQATVANVRAELARLEDPKRVSRQDRVLIVLAVHGTMKDQVGYFQLVGGGDNLLPMREVADAVLNVKGIPAKHVLMLADSCHAGSIVTNEPAVGADPDATMSDLFKRPYRGIWAASNSSGRAISDDSTQSTRMLHAIVASLASGDTYPLNVAGAADVLYKSKQFVPVTYTPLAEGSYIFALKLGKTDVGAERTRQESVTKERKRDETQSYVQYQRVLDAEKALAAADRTKNPKAWALAQRELGKAYAELPTGSRDQNLRKGIAAYNSALEVLTEKDLPIEWATTQDYLGAAYRNLPTGSKAANMAKAILYYEASLRVRTQKDFPMEWAATNGNLGIAYLDLPTGDHDDNVAKAIEYFEASLKVFTANNSAEGWAKTMNSLGAAYGGLTTGDRNANLLKAVDCYQAALTFYTENKYPEDWARSMSNLGIVYSDLPRGQGEYLAKAIECYEAALRVYSEKTYPQGWANTMGNLGGCYAVLPSGDKAANAAKAIEYYESSLKIFTEKDLPEGWAATMGNLGACYAMIPTEANIAKALQSYEASLRVYTKAEYPEDWARTMSNLGKAYVNNPGGDKAANLAKAISSYEGSLTVFSEQMPWERCEVLYGYAKAIFLQGDKDKAKSVLEDCLAVATKARRREYAEKATNALKSGF